MDDQFRSPVLARPALRSAACQRCSHVLPRRAETAVDLPLQRLVLPRGAIFASRRVGRVSVLPRSARSAHRSVTVPVGRAVGSTVARNALSKPRYGRVAPQHASFAPYPAHRGTVELAGRAFDVPALAQRPLQMNEKVSFQPAGGRAMGPNSPAARSTSKSSAHTFP
jgi:hypothetical protein